MASSSPALPTDVTNEILTRASLDTVGRCRAVSKQWNHLTYSSWFINHLSKRTNVTDGVFIQTSIRCEPLITFVPSVGNSNISDSNLKQLSLGFLPQKPTIEAVHQGILLCVTKDMVPKYYVCKPTTKEWEQIPNPKTRFSTTNLGLTVLRSNPLRYKIVRLSEPKSRLYKNNFILRCEMYDSEARKWQQLSNVALPAYYDLNEARTGVSACGALHWIIDGCRGEIGVFAFDVEEEKWEIFDAPWNVECNVGENKVTDYQGRLAWIRSRCDWFEIWVMENYKEKTWSKNMMVKSKGHYPMCSLGSIEALCSSDVAVMKGDYGVVYFNIGDHSYKVENVKGFYHVGQVFKFQSDLEVSNKLKGALKSRAIVKWFRLCKRKWWFKRGKYFFKIVGMFWCWFLVRCVLQLVKRLKQISCGMKNVLQKRLATLGWLAGT